MMQMSNVLWQVGTQVFYFSNFLSSLFVPSFMLRGVSVLLRGFCVMMLLLLPVSGVLCMYLSTHQLACIFSTALEEVHIKAKMKPSIGKHFVTTATPQFIVYILHQGRQLLYAETLTL